jgi:DNA-binding NarL/FixJ family response regulator
MMQKSDRSATKVLIVDDDPVVLSGFRSLFASDNTVKIEEATAPTWPDGRLPN